MIQVLTSGARKPLVPTQIPSLFCFPPPRNKLNVIDPRRKDRFINPNHPSYLGSLPLFFNNPAPAIAIPTAWRGIGEI